MPDISRKFFSSKPDALGLEIALLVVEIFHLIQPLIDDFTLLLLPTILTFNVASTASEKFLRAFLRGRLREL